MFLWFGIEINPSKKTTSCNSTCIYATNKEKEKKQRLKEKQNEMHIAHWINST